MHEINRCGVAAPAILGDDVHSGRDTITRLVQDENPPVTRVLFTLEQTQAILSLQGRIDVLVIGWVYSRNKIIDDWLTSFIKGYAYPYPVLLPAILEYGSLDSCVVRGHAALIDRLVIIPRVWVGSWG